MILQFILWLSFNLWKTGERYKEYVKIRAMTTQFGDLATDWMTEESGFKSWHGQSIFLSSTKSGLAEGPTKPHVR